MPEALFMVFELDSKSEKVHKYKSGRSLQELSNEYLLFSFKNRLRHIPSIVLARRKAPHCEVNLCQFVDANAVTIKLVIVRYAIDC